MTPEAIQTPVKPSMECFDGIMESCKWWSKTNNANDQPRIDIEIKCENSWTLQLIPETDVSLVMDWVSRAPSCLVTLLRIVVKFVKRSYMWIGMTIIDMIKSVKITEMRNWNEKGNTKWCNKQKWQLNNVKIEEFFCYLDFTWNQFQFFNLHNVCYCSVVLFVCYII